MLDQSQTIGQITHVFTHFRLTLRVEQRETAETANENNDNRYFKLQGKLQMTTDMLQNKLRDRLTLFWSNHFVTEDDTYRSPAYQAYA